MSDYIYTKNISDGDGSMSVIQPNDIVMLNAGNIWMNVDDDVSGLNPIPSFDIAKGISSAVSAIDADYTSKSSDNTLSGINTFIDKTQFASILAVSAEIDSLSTAIVSSSIAIATQSYLSSSTILQAGVSSIDALSASIEELEVLSALSANFKYVFNTDDDYLSSIHSLDQIKTLNNVYRLVDAIQIESGINASGIDFSISLDELVNVEIKQSIIRARQLELFNGHTLDEADSSDPLKVFFYSNDPSIRQIVDTLVEITRRLKIQKYSLTNKFMSIEKSINALEENLQSSIDVVKLSVEDSLLSIFNASSEYSLVDDGRLSVLTELRQQNGKVSISARDLLSSDIGHLSGFIDSKIADAVAYVGSNYLPLSGGKVDGDLSIARDFSLYTYDSNSIFIGDTTLCAALSNEIANGTSQSMSRLSIDLSNDFAFGYDPHENIISAHVAGKTLQFSADKFTEAKMISAVGVVYRGEGDNKKPYLQILFKTDSGIETVEISLLEIMPLYYGRDGVDIEYSADVGKYVVSADQSICRRDDISSIVVENTIPSGMILSSLRQQNGFISYGTAPILSGYVEGLPEYVDYALSNYNAPLSTIYGKWNIFQSDPNDPRIDEIRLSVTTEAGVDKTWYAPFSNGQQLADYQELLDQYYIKFPANGTIHETIITRKADYYILGNHINQPIQPKIEFGMLSALDTYPLDGNLDFDSPLSTVISAVVSIRDILKQLRDGIEHLNI